MSARLRRAHPVPPARSAADGLDFGHLHNEALGNQADTAGFSERYARIEQHVDGERAFVEGRQEGAGKEECRGPCRRDGEQRDGHQRALMAKGEFEQRSVASLSMRTSALSP